MRYSWLLLIFAVTLLGLAEPRKATAVYRIKQPTIIAYFPITQRELDGDTNEAYSDFLFYALTVEKHYRHSGIDVEINTDHSFRVVTAHGPETISAKSGAHYYFLTPDGFVHREEGVLTNLDLYAVVKRYLSNGKIKSR